MENLLILDPDYIRNIVFKNWNYVSWKIEKKSNKNFFESGLLRLNCNKARKILKWKSVLSFNETGKMVADWYSSYYSDPKKVSKITEKQIKKFQNLAKKRNLKWAKVS